MTVFDDAVHDDNNSTVGDWGDDSMITMIMMVFGGDGYVYDNIRGGFRGGVLGVYTPPLKTESAFFSRQFSVKQLCNSALNYRNTPWDRWRAPLVALLSWNAVHSSN
jgi:hypothetical protein